MTLKFPKASVEETSTRARDPKKIVSFSAPSTYLRAMKPSLAFRLAALLGFLGVALGAFGAHGLGDLLRRNGTLAIWEKAVFYHFIHTVVLLVLARLRPWQPGPWFCFLTGITVFSGSLYLLALTNARWLGAITPLGGASLLAGWLWLAICVARAE